MSEQEVEARAKAMARWWSEAFMIADKRDAFEEATVARVKAYLGAPRDFKFIMFYIDYDPNEELLHILRSIGVECRGAFSADGIFTARKFGMKVFPDGRCFTKDGYGEPWLPFPRSQFALERP